MKDHLPFILLLFSLTVNAQDVTLKPETSDACGTRPTIPYQDREELRPIKCELLSQITVHAKNSDSIDAVCTGAQRAIDFYREKGFESDRPIDIIIHDNVPEHIQAQGYSWDLVFGFVDTDDLRLYLPPKSMALSKWSRGILNTPVDEEFYISIAAHETTHILNQHFFAPECKLMPSEQQEFIAYAAQISTMEQSRKELVLQKFSQERWGPFESGNDINPSYHMVNPHGFGVKSYLFFNTEMGQNFFSDVLKGLIRPKPRMEF